MTDLRRLLRPELASLHAYETPASPAPIRLDANESPWPLPQDARRGLAEAVAALPLHRYPDPRATEVRERLAARVGAPAAQLVLGVGSDEVIQLLITALARPREGRARAVVMVPDPTFSMYGIIAAGHGLDVVRVPLDGSFGLDVQAFVRAIDAHRPNLVFLASPNNPTGNAFARGAVEAIAGAAHDAVVVVDEAYGAFSSSRLSDLRSTHPNVVLLGTLSKIGLASLRLGWAVAPTWLALELEKVRLTYNLPGPTQALASAALGPLWSTFEAHVASIVAERTRLAAGLAAIDGVTPHPSDANFVLATLGPDAPDVAASLRREGLQVRAFGAHHPRLASHLRFTVGTPAEDDALLSTLTRVRR